MLACKLIFAVSVAYVHDILDAGVKCSIRVLTLQSENFLREILLT